MLVGTFVLNRHMKFEHDWSSDSGKKRSSNILEKSKMATNLSDLNDLHNLWSPKIVLFILEIGASSLFVVLEKKFFRIYLKNPTWTPGLELLSKMIIHLVQVLLYMHIKFENDWYTEFGDQDCQFLIGQLWQNGWCDVIQLISKYSPIIGLFAYEIWAFLVEWFRDRKFSNISLGWPIWPPGHVTFMSFAI